MSEFHKLIYYDLRVESAAGRLPRLFGRVDEQARLNRIINRRMMNNCLVIGPAGIGKTTLLQGWISKLVIQSENKNRKFIQLDIETFYNLLIQPNLLSKYQEAMDNLPACLLVIDDFGALVYNRPAFLPMIMRVLTDILENTKVQVVMSLKPHEYKWLETQDQSLVTKFEVVELKTQGTVEQIQILQRSFFQLTKRRPQTIETKVLQSIIKFVERFGILGQLPAAGIKILDEALAQAQSLGNNFLTDNNVAGVVSEKANIPLSQLGESERVRLKNLEYNINQNVIGQASAIAKITTTIQRAKLGLRNPHRPLGSFLVLGPSGVGKTETAKLLAAEVFGRKENFIRIDMTEFSQEHTVGRLIGAPPGYVGFDEGGMLTNAIKKEPYSLILLDEIEKAHSKIFDIFLQILDDGRLTSGQGETVDFSQTIIVATSNLAVNEIIHGFEQKLDIFDSTFLEKYIYPALAKSFRLEFINRFDSVLVFKPLELDDLVAIAQLEISKIEQRVSQHKIKFNIDPQVLAQRIRHLTDPRFGARPVKRFIEETCETLITKNLLQ